MRRILKIFLTLVLALSMMLEIMPANIVHAEDTGSVEETELPAEQAQEENKTEEGSEPVVLPEQQETPPVKSEEPEVVALNETAVSEVFDGEELDGLIVKVAYEANTLPAKTDIVVVPAKAEAIEAIKEKYGEDVNIIGADISFWLNGKEFEPKDYDAKVQVTLSYKGEENLSDKEFETLHVAETLNDEGTVVYGVETVNAEMTDVKEMMEVPYEYTWTETVVTGTKEVPIYGDVEVEYTEEETVYETREYTEEQTIMVEKTREVTKTRRVKVKVDFVWWNPATWLGYKWVIEVYTEIETYEEPEVVTVTRTEEVPVTRTVTKTRIEEGIVGYETVDVTEEVVHTETGTREEEVVVGQIASFEAGEFSTFTITWSNNNRRVTIHHGYMENGSFVEFPAGSSTNTNYPTSLSYSDYDNYDYAVLIYDFKDYAYSATYYRTSTSSTPASGGTAIWPALQKRTSGDAWRYCNADRNSWNRDGGCANNSHIYVIYTPKTITKGYEPSSGGDDPGTPTPSDFTPDVGKNVTDQNDDGTYDITLGFAGNKDISETKTTARVIVVFDLSGSMNYNMEGGTSTSTTNPSRLTLAKNAVNKLAETLLALEDRQGNKLVEMGLVTFASDGRIRSFGTGTNASNFTSDYNTYSGVVSNLPVAANESTTFGTGINDIGRGTNWEKGLDLANSMATSTAGKTYIVFVSDGDPTYRVSRGSHSDSVIEDEIYNIARVKAPIFGSGGDGYDRNYDTAKEVAKSIVVNKKTLYVVGLSNDATRMTALASYSGGTYKSGNNADEFAASLSDIAGSISSEIGLTDVTITDGVTSMSHIETQSLIGTAGNFTYSKSYPLSAGESGYTYTIGTTTYNVTQAQVDAGSDGTHKIFSRQVNGATVYYIEYPWTGDEVPEATINANNSVVWDTSSANDQLEHGVYYSVTFTVWPKQEAYDLIADLDNGVVKVTDSDLAAGTKAQLRILIGSTTYEYDTATSTWTGGLTDTQMQALIETNDATFSMKTNTGLSAQYKYGGVEQTSSYTNYVNGNMSLDDTPIRIRKIWNNYLDAREASKVTLTVMRGDTPCVEIEMGEPVEVENEDGGKYWVQTPTQDIYISLGVLSVTDGVITVRETGYDYTVEEPENFSYRWDLTSDVYHPMVINGETTVLIKVTDTTDLPSSVTGLADNRTVKEGNYTYYKFGGVLYVTKSGQSLLEATNDRRSNLIINKTVEDTTAPADDLFPIQITLRNPNDPLPTETGYSEWYHTMWFYVSTVSNDRNTIVLDGVVVEGATPEVSELRTDNSHITEIQTHPADETYPYPYITYKYDGTLNTVKAVDLELHNGTEEVDGAQVNYQYYSYYTGFYWFDNGGTATVSIKDGWYINFNNMGRDTVYTIVEPTASMPDGYTLDVVTSDATNTQNETVVPATIDGNTATGTIDRPNSNYYVTYKNNYEGVFYVYHSGTKTVERLPMAVKGVAYSDAEDGKKFNIFAETGKYAEEGQGFLYGGYYHAYKGSTIKEDEGATLTYTDNKVTDTNGTAYSYQYIKESSKGAWDGTKAYTENGKTMVPVRDITYFLKEVPDSYLLPYTHYTYYKESKMIAGLLTISGIDDLNYKQDETGFVVELENEDATIVESLTIKAQNSSTSTVITAAKAYKSRNILDGYLGYADITDYIGNTITIKQYWTTLDGILVKGKIQRKLEFGNGTISQLKKTDTACED